MPRMDYDRDADAAYISLRDGATIAYTENLDGTRLIDYADDGEAVGVELLDVSEGVNLDDLPVPDVIVSLLERERIPIFA